MHRSKTLPNVEIIRCDSVAGLPWESMRARRSASIGRVHTRMAISTQTERTRPSELVRTEARALLELAMRLDGPMAAPFTHATDLVVEAASQSRRVIVLGMGKSGLIARKIAATLRSTRSEERRVGKECRTR